MADELLLSVEKLIYGGEGLAHAEGSTVFVPYVLPGEQVRAAVRTRKKKLIHTSLVKVEQASATRIAAPCPHFQVCGGCQYQHIEAGEQTRYKKEILRETLSRLGGISWIGEIAEHSAQPYGYRNRAQWAYREALPRALGYFQNESARIVPVDSCAVMSPALQEAFGKLQEMARSNTLAPGLLEIEAFADSTDTKIALNVAFERFVKPAKDLTAEFRAALPKLESLLLLDQSKNRFELSGPGFLQHQAGGFTFRVSHLSFFQVNRFLIEEMLQAVVGGKKGGFALDLVRGSGIFHDTAGEGVFAGGERGRQSCRDRGFARERENRGRGSGFGERAHGRVFEEVHGPAGLCGAGPAARGTWRGDGGAAGKFGSGGDCVSFLRSFDAGAGFGGADGIRAKAKDRSCAGASLRDCGRGIV